MNETTPRTIASLRKIAEGREAEIFAWDNGTVLKLYRAGYPALAPAHESAAMAAAHEAGAPVPAARGTIEVEGRSGLLMERIDGVDMLTAFGRKPWTLLSAGPTLGRVHAALHEAHAPATLPALKPTLARRIGDSPLVPEDLRGPAIAALDRLPDGDRLVHGDYHPANVILTPAGPRVIDWPNAHAGDPAADVARTLLMFRLGELPPGSNVVLRAGEKVARGLLTRGYKGAYRRAAPEVTADAVSAWMLPVAVNRLPENITEERERLLAYIGTLAPTT